MVPSVSEVALESKHDNQVATRTENYLFALEAVKTAKELGVKVSFDGNYRAYLWEIWKGDGPAIIRELISYATLALINERDISLVMGREIKDRNEAYAIAFREFSHPVLDCWSGQAG